MNDRVRFRDARISEQLETYAFVVAWPLERVSSAAPV